MTTAELIRAVRDHAERNYNFDGWDYLVECWDDDYIAEIIGDAQTEKSAVAACKRVVRMLDERRREIMNTCNW
jgi:hypothetical protein